MSEAIEDVLRLVAAGRLTPEEAEPILAALEAGPGPSGPRSEARGSGRGRSLRLEITDGGRRVVDLRLPASLGEVGLSGIPGLSEAHLDRIRAALRSGVAGKILEVGGDGDSVRIVIE